MQYLWLFSSRIYDMISIHEKIKIPNVDYKL